MMNPDEKLIFEAYKVVSEALPPKPNMDNPLPDGSRLFSATQHKDANNEEYAKEIEQLVNKYTNIPINDMSDETLRKALHAMAMRQLHTDIRGGQTPASKSLSVLHFDEFDDQMQYMLKVGVEANFNKFRELQSRSDPRQDIYISPVLDPEYRSLEELEADAAEPDAAAAFNKSNIGGVQDEPLDLLDRKDDIERKKKEAYEREKAQKQKDEEEQNKPMLQQFSDYIKGKFK